jgi:hypothetical protein
MVEMPFAERNDMVKTIPSDRTDEASPHIHLAMATVP